MIRGLPASCAFHAILLGSGYVVWPFVSSTQAPEEELVIVPIELVDLGEITNIAPIRTPEPEPEPEEPLPEPEPEPEEPELEEPEPDSVDETLPEDEIDTSKDTAPELEPEPEDIAPDLDAEPDPEEDAPEPEPEDAPVKKQADLLDDFLNDADNTFQSERQTRAKQPEPKTPPKRLLEDTPPKQAEQRRGAGERTGNTARLEALMYNAVRPCWVGVDDQPDAEKLNVRMRAELDQDGELKSLELIEPSRRPLGRSPMGIAVDRAMRAVRKCAPYNLPDDEYDLWKDININLGPAFGPK